MGVGVELGRAARAALARRHLLVEVDPVTLADLRDLGHRPLASLAGVDLRLFGALLHALDDLRHLARLGRLLRGGDLLGEVQVGIDRRVDTADAASYLTSGRADIGSIVFEGEPLTGARRFQGHTS